MDIVSQGADSIGPPAKLGDAFTLHKQSCGASLQASCRVVSHQLGWELRLDINGDLHWSEVCRTSEQVAATTER